MFFFTLFFNHHHLDHLDIDGLTIYDLNEKDGRDECTSVGRCLTQRRNCFSHCRAPSLLASSHRWFPATDIAPQLALRYRTPGHYGRGAGVNRNARRTASAFLVGAHLLSGQVVLRRCAVHRGWFRGFDPARSMLGRPLNALKRNRQVSKKQISPGKCLVSIQSGDGSRTNDDCDGTRHGGLPAYLRDCRARLCL